MTLSLDDRNQLIKHYVEKAEKIIEDVEFFIENEKFSVAVNQIYYSVFYILSALAIKYQFSSSKHTQLIGWFNKNFVKENKIDRKYSQYIQEAFEKRMKGDYEILISFSESDVNDLFKKNIFCVFALKWNRGMKKMIMQLCFFSDFREPTSL